MKKILALLMMLFVSGCITEYYIPLSEECMDKKITEIKSEMKKNSLKRRAFVVMYDEFALRDRIDVKEGEILPVYVAGELKFDNNLKADFVPARPFEEPESYEHQMLMTRKVQEIVNEINVSKKIDAIYMTPFDIDCYSGGGSVKIPYWLIEQEVRFSVEVDDSRFLSALEQYMRSEGRYFVLINK